MFSRTLICTAVVAAVLAAAAGVARAQSPNSGMDAAYENALRMGLIAMAKTYADENAAYLRQNQALQSQIDSVDARLRQLNARRDPAARKEQQELGDKKSALKRKQSELYTQHCTFQREAQRLYQKSVNEFRREFPAAKLPPGLGAR